MKLSDLIHDKSAVLGNDINGDTEISGVIWDTREQVKGGEVFVCVKGNTFDGHEKAREMLDKGCAAVVVECDLGLSRQILVGDSRNEYMFMCAAWFGNPQDKIKMIGVTGTNGKTTTTTLIKNILMQMGRKSGLIGTCQNEIGDEIFPTDRTTPEPHKLFELLDRMVKSGCEYVVMEVSSQGLEQKRVAPCRFEIAVFTNLTQDHLDVHGTMENYFKAKGIIFSQSEKALINIDDEYGRKYLELAECPIKTFSINHNSDYKADNIKLLSHGTSYQYKSDKLEREVCIKLPGSFNVSNTLAVIAALSELGFDENKAMNIIEKLEGVRGRAEIIPTGRDFSVICDYAHTPDAIENILSALKPTVMGRLICLFGCGGNRDAKKRPLMAQAAAKFADFCIVTSDNPRNEQPELIIEDILQGLPENTPHTTITDRREAIFRAVANAKTGDVIVLAGKGHEDYQVLAGMKKIHFDEREVVADALKALEEI